MYLLQKERVFFCNCASLCSVVVINVPGEWWRLQQQHLRHFVYLCQASGLAREACACWRMRWRFGGRSFHMWRVWWGDSAGCGWQDVPSLRLLWRQRWWCCLSAAMVWGTAEQSRAAGFHSHTHTQLHTHTTCGLGPGCGLCESANDSHEHQSVRVCAEKSSHAPHC